MSDGLARHVLSELAKAGVREICACPGGRNAEFVQLLADDARFKTYWFFEERSAAFFALGRIRSTGRAVAVVTTSGTAAGELLPATMEAYYSGLPLMLVTADRPRRFRGSGAPQTAEQVGLFGIYAPTRYDLEGDERCESIALATHAPVHLNVCFEDPNASTSAARGSGDSAPRGREGAVDSVWSFVQACKRPLVIVGQLDQAERGAVESFLESWGAPTYIEAPSGLRTSPRLAPIQLRVGDNLLARAAANGYDVDGVLRIGGIPTHRIWRDLEDLEATLPVVSISRAPFSGLGRHSHLEVGDMGSILSKLACASGPDRTVTRALIEADREAAEHLSCALHNEPKSEPALFRSLSRSIPVGSLVFLGNSLPIREWDLAADFEDRNFEFHANRGLNGIDGQISTFLGLCSPGRENWAILGDLTALYDLAAPWPLPQLEPDLNITLVVVNNRGGKIFERMFASPAFQNTHNLSFEAWAKLWGVPYVLADSSSSIPSSTPGLRVLEVRPDSDSTSRFWKSYGAHKR